MNRVLVALVVVQAAVIAFLLMRGPDDTQRGGLDRTRDAESTDRGPGTDPGSAEHARERGHDDLGNATPREPTSTRHAVVHGRATVIDGAALDKPVWISIEVDGVKHAGTTPNDAGHYALAGIPPGPCELVVRAPEYNDLRLPLALEPGVHRHDVALTRSLAIEIRFETATGEPVASSFPTSPFGSGLVAVATREPVDRLPMTALRSHASIGVGRFQAPFEVRGRKLPQGVGGLLVVEAAPPFHVHAVHMHTVLARQRVDAPVDQLTFVLDPEVVRRGFATAHVRFVDAVTGAPATGHVSIEDRQTGTPGRPLDAEGRVSIEFVAPGFKMLVLRSPEYEAVRTYVRVENDGSVDLGTFPVHKQGVLRGRLQDSAGAPVVGRVIVRNMERMTFAQPLVTGFGHSTDAQGSFEASAVGRGRYLVVPIVDGFARVARVVETSSAETTGVDFRLRTGTEVRFDAQHDGVHHYLLTVRDDAGTPVYTYLVRGAYPQTIRLLPGAYTLEIAEDGKVTGTSTLRVGDTTQSVTIRRRP